MNPGAAIGQYRILEPLGEGGMGIVYRARHLTSERTVALKTVRMPAPRWLDNIRREIDALTRIQHPGVVRIVDHGIHQGLPWYAMELLEGESLRHFVQRIWSPYRRPPRPPVGPTDAVSATQGVSTNSASGDGLHQGCPSSQLSDPIGMKPAAAGELRSVLQIVRHICMTLAFLHGEGIVNCDLKPENILLVGGLPIIIDFGVIAHYPGGKAREALEAPPGMFGTLPYMSPEQIRGELVDARSDLYSIGCILYELIVGSPPFVGAPREIRTRHLTEPPAMPSRLVGGVSRELEAIILRLLEKDVAGRFGYADEVAIALAEIADDNRRWDVPPPRPYLYRPRFVGRDDLLDCLRTLRARAAAGSGALVLVGGESGVGKTRFAMELTRGLPTRHMQIVTSEASSFTAEATGAVVCSPLHIVKPLLRAIADRCQEGGPGITESLLGERRSVLAQYEPLIAQVPADGNSPSVLPIAAEVARRRLFQYVSDTLACFSRENPILWILDDLGFADELSLAFLRSLTAEYLESIPVLILGTYRSEELTDSVAAIARLPHVTHVTLPRLDQSAVSSIVGDMLALRDPSAGLVRFIARQAEGNPFFVAEYLRSAVAHRVIYRDHQQTWQMLGRDQAPPKYESLPLPVSLREHIGQRIHRLTPAARHAALAIATIGREAELDTLQEVVTLSEEAAISAVDELLRCQVLEQPKPGRVRFAHDKLREVAYAQAAPDVLTELHGRAAVALESRLAHRTDASRFWAMLGHHFSAARRSERAAHYLKFAADHARSTHANEEAIALYRATLRQVNELLLSLTAEATDWHRAAVDIYEALGDVCGLAGQNVDARTEYQECLARLAEIAPTARARLLRKIGKMWEAQHQHDQALHSYGQARALLGTDADAAVRGASEEWFQVRLDEIWVHYWLNQVPEMEAIVSALEPLIDDYASPLQRVSFFRSKFLLALRRHRFRINEDVLQLTVATLHACQHQEALIERPMAQFHHGFALLFSGRLQEGERELETAAESARRAGDNALQARCVSYLALAARMQGRIDDTERLTERVERIAATYGMLEYVGAVRANRAWLALKRGDTAACRSHAREALEIWQSRIFPFQWTALLPLLESAVAADDLEEAVRCAKALIAPNQQALPEAVADALERAAACGDAGELRAETCSSLEEALASLSSAGYR
jgi:serine/threonine protein kinase